MAKEPTPPAPEPLMLDARRMLGIVQRDLVDLHAYCSQPPQHVDPHFCMQMLMQIADVVQRMSSTQMPVGKDGKGADARAAAN